MKRMAFLFLLIRYKSCLSSSNAPRKLRRNLEQLPPEINKDDSIPQQDIRGGTQVTEPLPYYGLFQGGPIACGCALIWPDVAVTAAHCLESGPPLQIRFNSTDRFAGDGVVSLLDSFTLHPDFIQGQITTEDIAVIKLSSSLLLDTVTLNPDANVPTVDGEPLYVMGYGIQGDGETTLTQFLYETSKSCFVPILYSLVYSS